MNRRKKVLVPIGLVVMMLAVISFTVPAVAQTIQRWIGYIPGFGLVNDDKLRTLVEPQSQTINGITLTVDELVASSDKTLVNYTISGVKDSMKTNNLVCPGDNSIPINSAPAINLSDGSKLQDISLVVLPDSGSYQFEATYSAISSKVQSLTFNLECRWKTSNGSSLWNFQIPLRLAETRVGELTVAPVVDIPTQITPKQEDSTDEQTSVVEKLTVSQVIPLQDGYILQGSLTIEPQNGLTVQMFNGYLEDVSIRDANNVTLMPSMVPDDFMVETEGNTLTHYNWALQISTTNIAWPLTITVNSIPAMTDPYAVSTFMVDVGENPQPGQEWVIEKDIPLGPKMVHVVSIKRVQNDLGMNGYEMTFIYDPSLAITYGIQGGTPNGGGGQGGGVSGEPVKIVRSFSGEVPAGVLSVQLNGQGMESIQGPWQVTLSEPAQ